jgi:NADH-quinone oxidoreductase subunit I
MIVKRKKLSFWERLYRPAIAGGFKVTSKHFVNTLFRRNTTAKETSGGFYPETKWIVAEGYRGAPYLVKDQDGDTKCVSCQLWEFVCPPKAIRITPPGPGPSNADRPNAEQMPKEFEINMLRCIFCGYCQEVCPEDAIFLQTDYSLSGLTREEMIYDKEKLLALGGVKGGIKKWENKVKETEGQEMFPVKP